MNSEHDRWIEYLRSDVVRSEYSRDAYMRNQSWGKAPPLRNLPPWRRWLLRQWLRVKECWTHVKASLT